MRELPCARVTAEAMAGPGKLLVGCLFLLYPQLAAEAAAAGMTHTHQMSRAHSPDRRTISRTLRRRRRRRRLNTAAGPDKGDARASGQAHSARHTRTRPCSSAAAAATATATDDDDGFVVVVAIWAC